MVHLKKEDNECFMVSTFNVWFGRSNYFDMYFNNTQYEGLNVQPKMSRALRTGQYDPYTTFYTCMEIDNTII